MNKQYNIFRTLGYFEEGIEKGEFKVFYQPIIDLRNGKIAMAESLARWESEEFGLVMPGKFVPILEEYGALPRLDFEVVRKVCKTLSERAAQGKETPQISVNMSWKDLDDSVLLDSFEKLMDECNLKKHSLCVELTESSIMGIKKNCIEKLNMLAKYDINISVDDFGQGYSFGTMCDVDFKYLKLDMGLIRELGTNPKVDLLTESLINIFHRMNAKVIAEGVETEAQLNKLRLFNCDYVQGFYFYKPMPEQEFFELVDSGCHPKLKALDNITSFVSKLNSSDMGTLLFWDSVKSQSEYISIVECLKNFFSIVIYVDIKNASGRLLVVPSSLKFDDFATMASWDFHIKYALKHMVSVQSAKEFAAFLDMSTIRSRIAGRKSIHQVVYTKFGKMRLSFVVAESDNYGNPLSLLYTAESL